jgi:acyl dehydratase
MDQIVQVLGSLLILTAFVAAQRGRLSTHSRLYLAQLHRRVRPRRPGRPRARAVRLAPVKPGDEITATVEVLEARRDKPITKLRTTIVDQGGTVVLDGTALVWSEPLG